MTGYGMLVRREYAWRKVVYICLVSTMLMYFAATKLGISDYYNTSSLAGRLHLINLARQERISSSVTLLRAERNVGDSYDSKAAKRQRLYEDYLDMTARNSKNVSLPIILSLSNSASFSTIAHVCLHTPGDFQRHIRVLTRPISCSFETRSVKNVRFVMPSSRAH